MPKKIIEDLMKFLGFVVDSALDTADQNYEKFKRQLTRHILVYGFFAMGLFLILFGLAKYLAEIRLFASEGVAFLVFGSIIIVGLAIYSLFERI